MKKINFLGLAIMFAMVQIFVVACSGEPVALTENNAKVILGAGYSGKTKIVVPKNVIVIGDDVFNGCTYLESIKLPKGLRSIGERAFGNCESLKSIDIPMGVKKIDRQAFAGCTSLESIVIPDSVVELGVIVFSGCKNLKSIKLSNSLTRLMYCFSDVDNITSVTIPSSITYIEDGDFNSVRRLENVSFEDPTGWYSYRNISVPAPVYLKTVKEPVDLSNPEINAQFLKTMESERITSLKKE